MLHLNGILENIPDMHTQLTAGAVSDKGVASRGINHTCSSSERCPHHNYTHYSCSSLSICFLLPRTLYRCFLGICVLFTAFPYCVLWNYCRGKPVAIMHADFTAYKYRTVLFAQCVSYDSFSLFRSHAHTHAHMRDPSWVPAIHMKYKNPLNNLSSRRVLMRLRKGLNLIWPCSSGVMDWGKSAVIVQGPRSELRAVIN